MCDQSQLVPRRTYSHYFSIAFTALSMKASRPCSSRLTSEYRKRLVKISSLRFTTRSPGLGLSAFSATGFGKERTVINEQIHQALTRCAMIQTTEQAQNDTVIAHQRFPQVFHQRRISKKKFNRRDAVLAVKAWQHMSDLMMTGRWHPHSSAAQQSSGGGFC